MKQEIIDIIKTKDSNSLLSLDEWDLEECLIKLVYDYFSEMPFESLNNEQKVIFLCVILEDTCQADSIFSLAEDEIFLKLPEMHKALIDIGALKTAAYLNEFINLIPNDTFEHSKIPEWNWFFENSEREEKISEIDSKIADYPDGYMRTIYHNYICKDTIAKSLLDNL